MTETARSPLVLVDGSSYLYRAFHAMPALTNSRGEPTGAVYGVTNMLRKLLKDYATDHVAVVFDAKGKTFRDAIYPEYKATRPPMPDELARQVPVIHEVVRAMGLPLLMVEGVEADDVIGTLCEQAAAQGMHCVVSTGDKDMAQLVNGHVTLVNTMTDTVLDADGVMEKFGVRPDQIVDYLSLIGDTVDNIPGVPKCGPKTAAKWLAEHGDLDTLIEQAEHIRGKVGENLRAALETLPLARRLATIKRDVPLDVGPEALRREPPALSRLQELYSRLEFRSWLAEVLAAQDEAAPAAAPAATTTRCDLVLDEAALEDWLERLAAAECFSLDLETSGLDYMQCVIVGVACAVSTGEGAYIPVAHDYPGAPTQLDRELVLARLKPLLEDPARPKLGQNLKYDMSVLRRYGIVLRGIRFDTMLESYVLDSTATRHDLDSLALKYLGQKTILFADVAGKGAKQLTFNEVPLEQAGPYAAEDAEIVFRLHQMLWPRIQDEPALRRVFEEIEMPLVPVLSSMECRGVLIDAERLRAQGRELAARMAELEQAAHAEAGERFNLGSPKQLQGILFERLGLPIKARTPKGQPSTSEAVLQELAHDYALPRLILEHRGLAKLKSTYTDKLPELIDPADGRVHTSYQQAVAATGRLSSSDPNLQNIPVRTEEGRRIRQAFVAAPGYRLLAADYSQIELRIMAHLSGDAGLLAAFAAGEDIHRATAAEVFGVPLEAVSADQRRSAKAINFGLIYGMSAFGLARQLGIGRGEAQAYVERYFARYPGVKEYMDATRQRARELGYVETVFGRRLYIPDIKSPNAQRRQYAERTAINAPMQGSAADIIKRAMIRIERHLQDLDGAAHMIMQVHDELVFEVQNDALAAVRDFVVRAMGEAAQLRVPLVVETGMGDNWDEAH